MLELYEYDFDNSELIAVLPEATEVKVTAEINKDYTLDFNYPMYNDKVKEITVNRLIKCEGQFYRIMTTVKDAALGRFSVNCLHIFDADSLTVHLPKFPTDDSLVAGQLPYTLICDAFRGSGIKVLNEEDIKTSLNWVEVFIDFETADKTSPKTVINQIIENCGMGEIYKDNKSVALVKRLRALENPIRLRLDKNLDNLTVTRDIEDIVNRLYPYGKSDATITKAYGLPYIDSDESIQKYGYKIGYKDYSDYENPEEILNHALWEFDDTNADRIDVPHITIEGGFIDLSKLPEYGELDKVELGDNVIVYDTDGTIYNERVIRLEKYPYEPQRTFLTIGRIKKDMAFYLNQIGRLSAKYNKISTISGKVNASQISGTVRNVSTSNVNMSTSGTMETSELIQVMVNNSSFVKIGIDSGKYVFTICDGNGNTAITLNDLGDMEFVAGKITVNDKSISTDADGDLCINGKKILLQEETENEA